MSNQYKSTSKMSADDYRTYDQSRRQQYPTTYRDKHPSEEAERDYNTYKQRTHEANASVDRYWDRYERHAGNRDVLIETLSQRQHSSLLPPAAEAASDTLTHAQARDNFLAEHPYAYKTGQTRMQHEKLAKSAYEDASYYRDRYDTHRSGSSSKSSSFPKTEAEDQYWQLDRTSGQSYRKNGNGTGSWAGPSSSSPAPRW